MATGPIDPPNRYWIGLADANPELVEKLRPALVAFMTGDNSKTSRIAGSGFIVAANSEIAIAITAKHVIDEIKKIQRPYPTYANSALFVPNSALLPTLDHGMTPMVGHSKAQRIPPKKYDNESDFTMRKPATKEVKGTASPSMLIDARIAELADWRGETLARVRSLIREADPGVAEEWKWGIPVWSHDGIICTGETYKKAVKLTFARGAALEDPSGLFNSSLEGKVRRAIDIHEGGKIDEEALKALIRAAVVLNMSGKATPNPPTRGRG